MRLSNHSQKSHVFLLRLLLTLGSLASISAADEPKSTIKLEWDANPEADIGKRHTTVLLDNAQNLKVRDNTPLTVAAKRDIRLKP